MDSNQAVWFTIAILATPLGAAAALRLFVEYTKDILDGVWRRYFGRNANTFVYALVVAYVIVYGSAALTHTLSNGMWFAHLFNGPLAAVLAKFMVKDSTATTTLDTTTPTEGK